MANDDILRNPELLSTALKKWLHANAYHTIELVENFKPKSDEYAEYTLLYEAQFKPLLLDRTYIELWLAENGKLGFGIELYDRVAKRLGGNEQQKRFVGGGEPDVFCDADGLFLILKLASEGRFSIRVFTTPFFGICHLKLLTDQESFLKLNFFFRNQLFWVGKMTNRNFFLGKLLTYKSWS